MADTLLPCPFCGGPAKTFQWNGTGQGQCAGDFKECAGTDVVAPVAMWNARALRQEPSVEEVMDAIQREVERFGPVGTIGYRKAAQAIAAMYRREG